MLFFELYNLMVNTVTYIGFRGGGDRPNRLPLDPPLSHYKWRNSALVIFKVTANYYFQNTGFGN